MVQVSNCQAQTTRYVKPTASGIGDGTSWANASGDLQAIIDSSIPGDSIFVAIGLLEPLSTIKMKDSVMIYGSFAGTEISLAQRETNISPTEATIIDGGANGNSYIIANLNLTAAAVLDGFTITGGYNLKASKGGGIDNYYSSPTINNCTFSSNSTNYMGGAISNVYFSPKISNCIFTGNRANDYYGGGGAIVNSSSSPIIINCVFSLNTSERGCAIFNSSSPAIILNCSFIRNSSPYSGLGGGIFNAASSPTISNCTFIKNAVVRGGGMYNTSNSAPVVTNCSFGGNLASFHGGAIYNSTSLFNPVIKNCIVFGNSDGIYEEYEGATTAISYSLVQGLHNTANGNIDGNINPMFVNVANNNLQLQSGSVCIEAGDSTGKSLAIGNTDVADRNRYVNALDMGAYEWQLPKKWYVKTAAAGGNDNFDGKTWATAFATIQRGIDTANANDSVFVGRGTYQPSATINMRDGVKIFGSFAGTEVSLAQRLIGTAGSADTSIINGLANGDNAVITNKILEAAVLDGFKITGGKAGGMYNESSSLDISNCTFSKNTSGSGLYNISCSTNIRNCVFSGNTTLYDGAGINSSGSSGFISNCAFIGNSAGDDGGGISNSSSSPVISNCIFSGNSSGFNGGGLYNAYGSSPIVTNCTFSGNDAYFSGGGMFNSNSSPILKNCIVYGNKFGVLGEGLANPSISYSLIQGMAANAANHNLNGNTNPLFVNAPMYYNAPFTGGNYRLLPGSPALNAGDSLAISRYIGNTDLDGNARYDGTIDLGAYEMGPSYRFTGSGNWSNPANWQNGIIPPSVLPPGGCIVIAGNVSLDILQTISRTAILIVRPGAILLLPSNLTVK